jgi:hypothetical protein
MIILKSHGNHRLYGLARLRVGVADKEAEPRTIHPPCRNEESANTSCLQKIIALFWPYNFYINIISILYSGLSSKGDGSNPRLTFLNRGVFDEQRVAATLFGTWKWRPFLPWPYREFIFISDNAKQDRPIVPLWPYG